MNYNRFLDTDFKHSGKRQRHRRFPALLLILLLFCSVAIGSAVVSTAGKLSAQETSTASTESVVLALADKKESHATLTSPAVPDTDHIQPVTEAEALEEIVTPEPPPTEPQIESSSKSITVKSGDTLGTIFSDLNIYRELYPILSANKDKQLKSIRPGQKLDFHFENDAFIGFDLQKSVNHHLQIRKQADGYQIEEISRPFEKRVQVASGTIRNSLFLAGQKSGMTDALIMELANIFGWDIDFALDIRTGDKFTVLYEENYLDGEKVSDGRIIAAEFVNDGHPHKAIQYTDSKGNTDYYDPSGKSMRKPFLRTPVDFARISSRFNMQRKHPILNRIRAHKGVDYAAASGTPIKASGDGKIVHRGKKGGYGNTIVIKHGSTYSTLYAHMSKFAGKTAVGSRVKQGQTIGYVGKSGLATGPHLHYEFRVNGIHRNPLTVKLPSAQSLPQSEMARFKQSIQESLVKLETLSNVQIARNDTAE